MNYRALCKTLLTECRRQRRVIRAMQQRGDPKAFSVEYGMFDGRLSLVVTHPGGDERRMAEMIAGFLGMTIETAKTLAEQISDDAQENPNEVD